MSALPDHNQTARDLRDLSIGEMRDQVLAVAAEMAPETHASQLADLIYRQFNKTKAGDDLAVLDDLTHGEMYSLLLFLRYRRDKRTHDNTERITVQAFE